MSTFEEHTHVFIVRIWREPRELEGIPAPWRGVVEHSRSGARRYLKSLHELVEFVAQHVEPPDPPARNRRLSRWFGWSR